MIKNNRYSSVEYRYGTMKYRNIFLHHNKNVISVSDRKETFGQPDQTWTIAAQTSLKIQPCVRVCVRYWNMSDVGSKYRTKVLNSFHTFPLPHICNCVLPVCVRVLYVRPRDCVCVSPAVGESGGWGSRTSWRNQWGAERSLGPNQWLPVSGLAPPEPGPDESQRHQWDHEHGETLHQTPQGHLRGTKTHTHTHGRTAVTANGWKNNDTVEKIRIKI